MSQNTEEPEETRLTDELQEKGPMQYMQFTIAVYVALGVGYWFTVFLASRMSGAGSDFSSFMGGGSALFFGLILAPLLAIITGVLVGQELDRGQSIVAATSAIGSAVGVVAMSIVVFILIALFSSSGAGGGGGESFPTGVLLGYLIGIGATGALGAWVTHRFGRTVE